MIKEKISNFKDNGYSVCPGLFTQKLIVCCVSTVLVLTKETAGKGGHQKLKSSVKVPYNWKDALEQFKQHKNKVYHKEAMITGSDFRRVTEDPCLDIRNVVDSARKSTNKREP